MDRVFENALEKEFIWLPEKGWGYFNVVANVYNQKYFDQFQAYEGLERTEKLNKARVELVDRFLPTRNHMLVDVGIGSGTFIKTRGGNTLGYDVNPAGIKWLKEQTKFMDVYEGVAPAISCWDSFEHIHDSTKLLQRVVRFAFICLPIFKDCEDVLKSKHFKKAEHVYYFTEKGIISYMQEHDFNCVLSSNFETDLGRENIQSFVFERCY